MNINLTKITKDIRVIEYLKEEVITAFYASSANDTKAFTFLSKYFFNISMLDIKAPNFFIYVDNEHLMNFDFEDDDTKIEIKEEIKLEDSVSLLFLEWVSKIENITEKKVLLKIIGKNEDVGSKAVTEGFVPYFFIGVSDGCRMGGNEYCVNTLKFQSHMNNISKYWVTDHFKNANIPNELGVGGVISSEYEEYPYIFKKIRLLSTEWGNYGHASTLGGATLFSVENKNTITN